MLKFCHLRGTLTATEKMAEGVASEGEVPEGKGNTTAVSLEAAMLGIHMGLMEALGLTTREAKALQTMTITAHTREGPVISTGNKVASATATQTALPHAGTGTTNSKKYSCFPLGICPQGKALLFLCQFANRHFRILSSEITSPAPL